MLDRSSATLLSGLSLALTDPPTNLLHGTRQEPGLFPRTAVGRQAAQRSKEEGYLEVVRTEQKGKSTLEHCTLTPKGMGYLLAEGDPEQILGDFIRAVEKRESQIEVLLTVTRELQGELRSLRRNVSTVFDHFRPSGEIPSDALICQVLQHWSSQSVAGDCPLPELIAHCREQCPSLTTGAFHDALRRLHEQEQIYLHPWTGPLYAIPEPSCALLVGHEIAFYASIRS